MTVESESVLPEGRSQPAEDRKQRAKAALLSRFPKLAGHLDQAPTTTLIRDGEAGIDIDLGADRLYGADGRTLAAEQLAQYLDKPLRFFVTDLRGTNLASGVSTRLFRHLMAECETLGLSVEDIDVKPRYDGCFLVILGVGLGHFLGELIEKTRARTIIIVEPEAEFLRHSLETVDWEEILTFNEERGCHFTISVPDSAETAVRMIAGIFNDKGFHFIDGAYVFTHYPSFLLFKTRDRLAEDIQSLFSSRGYFEDELIMLSNTVANLATTRFRLLDPTLRPERPEPVFIIGSGPSIDQNLEHIKRLRDRAVVFSCGTGLRVCLGHGIIPDFHCELENGGQVYESLTTVRRQFPFTGITLVGSTTLDTRVAGLFDDVILFFRDSISGSRILATPEQEVLLAVPTVANTGLRTALAMGFRTFYLFGIDCGTKYADKRHSDDSVYSHSKVLKKAEAIRELAYTFRGNFGGLVKSDWVFTFSRLMLVEVCRLYRPKVFNCSDGSEIEYTTPKVAASIKLPELPRHVVPIKRVLDELLRLWQPGEMVPGDKFAEIKQQVEVYRQDGLDMIDRALEQDKDFIQFWARLDEFLKASDDGYAQVPSLIKASLRSMPKIGMFFVHRVRGDETRATLFTSFLNEYRAIFEFMCDGANQCLDDLSTSYRIGASP
jgi:hypothetical protein